MVNVEIDEHSKKQHFLRDFNEFQTVNEAMLTSEINLFLRDSTVLGITSEINNKHIKKLLFSRDSTEFGMVNDDISEYFRKQQSPIELIEFETVREVILTSKNKTFSRYSIVFRFVSGNNDK
jgi:hypothetical protein